MTNVLCIGAGYVGGPTMAIIAKNCPQHRIVTVDVNAEKIAAWQSDQLPIYEPGLKDIVLSTRDKNLFFSTEIGRHIAEVNGARCVSPPRAKWGDRSLFIERRMYD